MDAIISDSTYLQDLFQMFSERYDSALNLHYDNYGQRVDKSTNLTEVSEELLCQVERLSHQLDQISSRLESFEDHVKSKIAQILSAPVSKFMISCATHRNDALDTIDSLVQLNTRLSCLRNAIMENPTLAREIIDQICSTSILNQSAPPSLRVMKSPAIISMYHSTMTCHQIQKTLQSHIPQTFMPKSIISSSLLPLQSTATQQKDIYTVLPQNSNLAAEDPEQLLPIVSSVSSGTNEHHQTFRIQNEEEPAIPFQRLLSMKMTEVWHRLDDFKRDGEENHNHTELIINQSQQRLDKHLETQEYLNKSTELLIERFSADLETLEERLPTTSDLISFPSSDEGNVALDFWGRTCYLNEVWGVTRSLFHLQRIEGGKNCAEWHTLLAKLGKKIQLMSTAYCYLNLPLVSLRHAASSQWLIDPGHDSEDLFQKVLQHLDTILSKTQSKESDKAKQSPLNLNTSFPREHDLMNEEAYIEDLNSTKQSIHISQGVPEHTVDSFLTLEEQEAASAETQNAQIFTGFPSGYESNEEVDSTPTPFFEVSSHHEGYRLDYLFDSAEDNPPTEAPMQSHSMNFVSNCNELIEQNANRDSFSNVIEGANPCISPIKMGILPQSQTSMNEVADVTFVSISMNDRKASTVSRVSSQEDGALDYSCNDLRVFPYDTSSDTMTARANVYDQGSSHDLNLEMNAHYFVNARNIEPRRPEKYALSLLLLLLFFTAFCSAYTWSNLSVADFEGATDEAAQLSRNEKPLLEPGLLTSHTLNDYRYRQWQSDIRMLQDITGRENLIEKFKFENEGLQSAAMYSYNGLLSSRTLDEYRCRQQPSLHVPEKEQQKSSTV
ncbi:hypothetical protein F5879DRAFT_995025 [Lentinula edodes]|nr:hypothetical protein F5879DRAFT_995025 [Lentinula edodes]